MISRLWLILMLLMPQAGVAVIVCPTSMAGAMPVATMAGSDDACEPVSCCCCPPDSCPCLHDTSESPDTPKAPAPTEDGPRTIFVPIHAANAASVAAGAGTCSFPSAGRHDLQRLSFASWQAYAAVWLT